MSFDEPHPEYRSPATWPIWATYGLGLLGSLLVIATHTGWPLLAYLPLLVTLIRSVTLAIVRSRRFDRESDAWLKRMHAYYDRRVNSEWN